MLIWGKLKLFDGFKKEGFRLEIKRIKNEPFDPSFGGFYINDKGTQYLLTHPQALTLRHIDSMQNFKERFDFFCYAFMRECFNYWYFKKSFKRVRKEYDLLYQKFGYIWRGGVHYTLPPIGDLPSGLLHYKVITRAGLNRKILLDEFRKFEDYKFILP